MTTSRKFLIVILAGFMTTCADGILHCDVKHLRPDMGAEEVAARIQSVIDACASAASATHKAIVHLPPGAFVSGSMVVRSFIDLRIPSSTLLRASLEASTFAVWRQARAHCGSRAISTLSPSLIRLNMQRSHYGDGAEGMSLIRLQNCTKCSVSGGGILNGQAQQWVAVHWPTRKLTRYLIRHNCYCCAAALCIDLIGRGCACVLFVLRPTCLLIRLCNHDVAAQELERPWLLPCAIRVPSQSDQGRRRIRGTDERQHQPCTTRQQWYWSPTMSTAFAEECHMTRLSERRRPCKASSWWMRRTGRSTSSGAATLRCPM